MQEGVGFFQIQVIQFHAENAKKIQTQRDASGEMSTNYLCKMDVHTPEGRRKNMQAIRSKNTKAEVLLCKALWHKGYRYRKNDKTVYGTPDLTFKKLKIAIFVDSEFFHGRNWEIAKYRIRTNRDFWWDKIERNIKRDEDVINKLTHDGWKVLRFWDKEILKKLANCLSKIENTLMPVKYSEIKRKLNLQVGSKSTDDIASFTHYLHSGESKNHFKSQAKKYLQKLHETFDLVEEDLQYYLPIKWDIPFPPTKEPKFKFIDLFAGIGGIRLAYQSLGGQCVFSSEWNHFAQKTYEANFGEVPFGDITKIKETDIPNHDVLLAGFPCQPFSIAGVSKKNALGRKHGFYDETQGTLFFDIVRILKHKKPKAFMLENVKNLVSHDKGNTFDVILGALNEIGYSIHHKVLDGKHFVPQHRERIFIVGFRKEVFDGKENFQFPILPQPTRKIKEILEVEVESKYTLSLKLWNYLQAYADKHKQKGNGFGFGLVDLNGISRTMSARYYKDGAEILIPQAGKNPRRLTPRECARLQGFDDRFVIPVSDNQAYRQFGNSVTVPLIKAVAKQLIQTLMEKNNGTL